MGRRGAPSSDELEEITVHPHRGGGSTEIRPKAGDQRRLRPGPPPSQRDAGDFRPFRRWFPFLIPTFVVANVVMFAASMYENDCPATSGSSCIGDFLGRFSFQPLKENAVLGPSAETLLKMGALQVSKVIHEHEGWRLFSCIWLHAGLLHLFANMLSLAFIGIKLEQEFGFFRICPLYIVSGIGGSLLSALFIESTIMVGASGALFGLLGAMLSELIINWTIYANKYAALLTLVVIIAINLAVGLLPHMDNFAHIGGFLTGFLLGFVLLVRPQFAYVSQKSLGYPTGASKQSKFKIYQYVLGGISIVLLVVGFVVGLILLSKGVNVNKHCSWCHYLTCVPTSRGSCRREASCMSSLMGNQLNLTCGYGGRTKSYLLENANDSQILIMCQELCK